MKLGKKLSTYSETIQAYACSSCSSCSCSSYCSSSCSSCFLIFGNNDYSNDYSASSGTDYSHDNLPTLSGYSK